MQRRRRKRKEEQHVACAWKDSQAALKLLLQLLQLSVKTVQNRVAALLYFLHRRPKRGLITLSGGDNWRRLHGGEWTAETQRRTTYCRDLQYGSWSTETKRLTELWYNAATQCHVRYLCHECYWCVIQLLRSVVWLLIFWIKYLASQFVIVLRRLSNYASEYTADRVLQVT